MRMHSLQKASAETHLPPNRGSKTGSRHFTGPRQHPAGRALRRGPDRFVFPGVNQVCSLHKRYFLKLQGTDFRRLTTAGAANANPSSPAKNASLLSQVCAPRPRLRRERPVTWFVKLSGKRSVNTQD